DGINLGTAWREPAFDDQTWSEGGALLFNETASLPAAKVTPLTLGPTTFYFRTRFSFEGNPAAVALHLTTIIDDGAVIYLNGHEIFRIGMPAGSISASTFANRNTPDATLEGPFTIPATHLQDG